MKQLVVIALVACSAPAKPPVVGNTTGGGKPLGAVLEQEVGAGTPVAILPGDSLRAVSADGARSRVLVASAVSWVLVDQRAHAIWFGDRKRTTISVLDLDAHAPDPVTIVTGLPGELGVKVLYPDPKSEIPMYGEELAFGHPQAPSVVLSLGAEPSLNVFGGMLEIVGDDETLARLKTQVLRATIANRPVLAALGQRGGDRSTHPHHKSAEHRVPGVDPAACDGDAEMCGRAEELTGTELWRVTVGHSCGDACYLQHRLYDPRTRTFVAGDWAERLQDAWIAADGSAFITGGVVYRFSGGPLAATPAVEGIEGGGWLGTSYYYGH